MMMKQRQQKPASDNRRRLAMETLEDRRVLAASVGWDGPGLGKANLTYHISNAPSSLSQAEATAAIEKAFAAWSSVADITFTPTNRAGLNDSIDISFRRLDGPGGTLAQAYFPDDVNASRIAGDIQFDNSESWEIGNSQGNRAMDLVWVAVHEIGHSLGLDHHAGVGSVLASAVSANQSFQQLAASDIAAVRNLYAAKTSANVPASNAPTSNNGPSVTPSPVLNPRIPAITIPTITIATFTTGSSDTSIGCMDHGNQNLFGLLGRTSTQITTRFDTILDGSLSREEVSTKLWNALVEKAVDSDGDSIISTSELDVAIEASRGEEFALRDSDGDGVLVKTEVSAKTWRRIASADTDANGGVSLAELKSYVSSSTASESMPRARHIFGLVQSFFQRKWR